MARDSTLYAQHAALVMLKRAPTLNALVPADRTYPPQRPPNPTWPFVAVGEMVAVPFVAAGLDGSAGTFAVHCYAETTDEADGRELASTILQAAVAVLGGDDGAEVALQSDLSDCPYPATAYYAWTGSQVVQDGADASAFHGFATFDVSISS
jgi:NADPH-dependent ferric siderophore reductase